MRIILRHQLTHEIRLFVERRTFLGYSSFMVQGRRLLRLPLVLIFASAGFAVAGYCVGPPVHPLRVLDVLRVRTDGPASAAVLTLEPPAHPETIFCDALVAGASTGGVAAAIALDRDRHSVCMTEETDWIGGQMTAQGVSAFDGNRYIETSGATASFEKLRRGIRVYYQNRYRLSDLGKNERFFNPGNCWVSSLCFEAPVALGVLSSMLQPYETTRLLRVFLRTKAVKVNRHGRRIASVLTYGFASHRWIEFHARYILDATDTGELLPLSGVPYSTGAEPRNQTGEPHAREGKGDPNDDQSLTYTFVLRRDRGGEHRIAKPPGYEARRRDQPYTLTVDYGGGKVLTYRIFEKAPGSPGSFWTYRRLIDAANFAGADAPLEVAMINWPGNDYCGPGMLANNPDQQAQALREAKLTALGLVYWLQNDVPRDEGEGHGYPGLELASSALGSADGLSQFPYIRESRRIHAVTTIKEQEISPLDQKGPRAALFTDSAGVGFYPIDIHSCSKQDVSLGAKPFQLPLGALIPQRVENLLAASKDIGTTHITNGAYRLHPIEWAIGEAAGTLAGLAIEHGATPRQIKEDPKLTAEVQLDLLRHGAPIYWFDDLQASDPAFSAAQFVAAHGVFGAFSGNLHFAPHEPLTLGEAAVSLERTLEPHFQAETGENAARSETPSAARAISDLVRRGYLSPRMNARGLATLPLTWKDLELASVKCRVSLPPGADQSHPLMRAEFAVWLARAYEQRLGIIPSRASAPREGATFRSRQ